MIGLRVCSEEEEPQRIRAGSSRLASDGPGLRLEVLESPCASLIDPSMAFVEAEERSSPALTTSIVMAMALPRARFDGLLLHQRGIDLRQALHPDGNRGFTLVRYHLPA